MGAFGRRRCRAVCDGRHADRAVSSAHPRLNDSARARRIGRESGRPHHLRRRRKTRRSKVGSPLCLRSPNVVRDGIRRQGNRDEESRKPERYLQAAHFLITATLSRPWRVEPLAPLTVAAAPAE